MSAGWRRLLYFDAFPKLEKNYQHATSSGGFMTIIVTLVMSYLALSEFAQFWRVRQSFEFLVDQTRSTEPHPLQINIDLTVAMPCKWLRSDVLDVSGMAVALVNDFTSTDTPFETLGVQKLQRQTEERLDVHKIIAQARKLERQAGQRNNVAIEGCRIEGSARVNKVSGMLHITALGHGYDGEHMPHDAMNFSHRIDKLSFGINYPGLKNPLDRSLEISEDHLEAFQYFISIVPTIFIDQNSYSVFGQNVILTNQYAVTDHQRILRPDAGMSGVPGIFLKYDIENILVRVTESRERLLHFLVRLCGLIGGVFVTFGVIHNLGRFVLSIRHRLESIASVKAM